MQSSISEVTYILLVGMTTVLFILSLVVLSSKILIAIVNNFSKEIILPSSSQYPTSVSNEVISVVVATVNEITNNAGQVTKIIKKIKSET